MATPLEYRLTPEPGECTYDEASVATAVSGAAAYLSRVAGKYALPGGLSPITFRPETKPAAELLGKNGSLATSLISAANEVQDAAPRFGRGLTTTYAESVKNTFYRAALIVSELEADSFTELFKSAVLSVANSPNASAAALPFIFEWGNFVLDKAVMGSVLYRTLYTQGDATDMAVQRAKARDLVGDMGGLVGSQDPSLAQSHVISENGKNFRFELSKSFNVGELQGVACRIGSGINPQVRQPPSGLPSWLLGVAVRCTRHSAARRWPHGGG